MNLVQATVSRLLRSAPVIKRFPSVRGAIHLDKDWGPGDYPRTEEERKAAAKKYNLLPEEYEAYDPDKWEITYGDYPRLPNLHRSDHDSDMAWDYPMHNHNWGEAYHINYMRYIWHTPEMHFGEGNYLPARELFGFLIAAMATTLAMTWFFIRYERVVIFKPMHRFDSGEVHYHYPNSNIEMYEAHHHH